MTPPSMPALGAEYEPSMMENEPSMKAERNVNK
jgi:hypothetical protein